MAFLIPGLTGTLASIIITFRKISPNYSLNTILSTLVIIIIATTTIIFEPIYQITSYVNLLLFITYFVGALHLKKEQLEVMMQIFITGNTMLLLSFAITPFGDYFYVSNAFVTRFKGVTLEPSILGLFAALSIHLFMFSDNAKKTLFIAMAILVGVLTLSGSFMLMILLIFFYQMRFRKNVFIFLFFVAGLILVLPYLEITENLHRFTILRMQRTLSGDLDHSTYLRFVAPFDVISTFSSIGTFKQIFLGVGNVYYQDFIIENGEKFYFLSTWNGVFTGKINNIIAVVFVSYGLLGIGLLSVGVLYFIYSGLYFNTLLLLFCFFLTGHLISPIFAFIYVILAKSR